MNLLDRPWNVVYLAGFVVYVTIRGAYARGIKPGDKVHRRVDCLEKLLMLLVIPTSVVLPLLYLLSPWLSFADYRVGRLTPWCGMMVMVAALWLFWRSHADLGRNWSVSLEIDKGHTLIEHGVYRSVRHPMYSSIFLWCIAQGLLLPNWLAGWAALAAFSLMYVLRTPREERMMCEFFGQRYRNYMARTGRLLPRLKRYSK